MFNNISRMISLQALTNIRRLTDLTSNPERTYTVKKNLLKMKMKVQCKLAAIKFLTRLEAEGVGTGEIEDLAIKNVYGFESKGEERTRVVEREVRRILRMRLVRMEQEAKSMKFPAAQEERNMIMVMQRRDTPPCKASCYRAEESREMMRLWTEKEYSYKERVQWLIKKHKIGRRPEKENEKENAKLRGVIVGDEDVEKVKNENGMGEQVNVILFMTLRWMKMKSHMQTFHTSLLSMKPWMKGK